MDFQRSKKQKKKLNSRQVTESHGGKFQHMHECALVQILYLKSWFLSNFLLLLFIYTPSHRMIPTSTCGCTNTTLTISLFWDIHML